MNNLPLYIGIAAVPFVSLVIGIILWRDPPSRNAFFGFRNKLSMSGDELWYTAQRLCGRLLTAVSAPMTVIAAAVVFLVKDFDSDGKFIAMLVTVGVEISALAAVNIKVERRLKKEGERNGE